MPCCHAASCVWLMNDDEYDDILFIHFQPTNFQPVAAPGFGGWGGQWGGHLHGRGANFSIAHSALNRDLAHRRRRRRGDVPPPKKKEKNRENIFFVRLFVKFRHFGSKNHVTFRHLVNFSYLFFGQKCIAPRVD